MAEVVVSAATNVLLGKLISFTSDEISLVWGFKDGMRKLQTTLGNIEAVLIDAERQQIEQKTVTLWLEKLKDAAHEVEDILDEFAYEALRRKLEVQGHIQNKVKNFFSISNPVVFRMKMAHKIKELNKTLGQISRDKDAYSLNVTGITNKNIINRDTHSHIVVDSVIIGREKDKSKIIELLLDSSANDQQIYRIVVIVGMGGVGKTTLAQIVYGDDALKQYFEKRVWVCVSDNSNQKQVFHQLLESINCKKEEYSSLDVIINILEEKLHGKRCLIVLDDMWNDEHNEWDTMLNTLLSISSRGSKVIITTRSNEVASMITGSLYRYTLAGLHEYDCWSMLENIAFGPTGVGKTKNLIKIGKNIARKCRGVPLATKVLGSLMCSKRDEHEWLAIENSEIWELPEGEAKIVKVLKLSYDHLEAPLKQCYRYCSLFPKDHYMRRKNIIRLWMAEGFLRPNTEMENVGNEYLDRLVNNSFLEKAKVYISEEKIIKTFYKMHDLVHDLAQSVAKTECSIINVNKIGGKEFIRLRHVNLVLENEFLAFPRALSKMKKLRTLLSTTPRFIRDPYNWHSTPPRFIDDTYGLQICKNFKYVRVLDLSRSKIRELPPSIGKLKHLSISKYPEWIPPMPRKVRTFNSLRCLPIFVVGNKADGFGIQELRDLNLLDGKLKIHNLENISDRIDAMAGGMKEKPFIRKLKLHWSGGNENRSDDFEVLEGLQPHQNLKRLGIHEYAGLEFPNWTMSLDAFLPNLVHVVLKNCKKCEHLPPLGLLPFLKVLKVEGFEAVKSIGIEFYGSNNRDVPSFPSLEVFSINRMDHLVDWSDHVSSSSSSSSTSSSFPRLESLNIIDCPNLRSMPTRFPSLKWLRYMFSNGNPISSLVEGNLSSLSSIVVEGCLELVSLPYALLRGNNILTELRLLDCNKFEGFIPNQCLEEKEEEKENDNQVVILNTRLHSLVFQNCPAFNCWLQVREFYSLRVLGIFNCGKSQQCIPSGIQYLPKLYELTIGPLSEELNSFPFPAAMVDEERTVIGDYFPSLRSITIAGWSKLQSLPDDLQYITSLQKLRICDFQSLVALPEWMGDLASLRLLGVRGCENLKYLPSQKQMQRLTLLQELNIKDCPILEDRCKEGGEEYYKISQIVTYGFRFNQW